MIFSILEHSSQIVAHWNESHLMQIFDGFGRLSLDQSHSNEFSGSLLYLGPLHNLEKTYLLNTSEIHRNNALSHHHLLFYLNIGWKLYLK